MAHTAALVEVLKRELKARGITYASLAPLLQLSEASVKRMFSRRDFTLKRLDEICRHAQIEFSELARTVVRDETLISHLTPEQEKEIVADRKLFLVAVCALNHVTFDQIVETYDITSAECVQLLSRLDRLKFIELLPGNRIKLLISRTFAWLPDGPIQRFFNNQAHYVRNPLVLIGGFRLCTEFTRFLAHFNAAAAGARTVATRPVRRHPLHRWGTSFTSVRRCGGASQSDKHPGKGE